MDKPFSLYLDLLRFLAALAVVACHFTQHGLIGPAPNLIGNLGREAVMLFFVLSGFVVAWSTDSKALSLQQFALARAARIYSVALPLLLAAFLAGLLAWQVAGVRVESGYQLLKPYLYLPLHLLFLGEAWTLAETPPWLTPWWSLCYEVWYYILFGIAVFGRGKWRMVLLALALLLVGYKLWLLLPVWLAGVWLYRRPALPLSLRQARAGWLATLLAFALAKLLGLEGLLRALGQAWWPFPALPLGIADRFLYDYLVCSLIVLHFLCARQAQFAGLVALERPIRALAAYTFTLYLVHSLVIGLWRAFYAHNPSSALDVALLTICIGLATYTCGLVTEKRRAWFRRRIQWLLDLPSRRLA